jgi:hypothetical protein
MPACAGMTHVLFAPRPGISTNFERDINKNYDHEKDFPGGRWIRRDQLRISRTAYSISFFACGTFTGVFSGYVARPLCC